MARVRVAADAVPLWTTELGVRISDINYGRHLGHDAMVSLIHEARVRFFADHRMREWDVDGAGTVVVELAVRYRAEAFWGDRLRVEIFPGTVRSRGAELLYRLSAPAADRVVADAVTGLAFVDPMAGTLVPVPERFAALLGGGGEP